jgi:hypothetical protein
MNCVAGKPDSAPRRKNWPRANAVRQKIAPQAFLQELELLPMKDLEEQQRAMRERNKRLAAKKDSLAEKLDVRTVAPPVPASKPAERNELEYLRRCVSALEHENAELRREVQTLRQSSAKPQKSYDEDRREQQHNFFKYSNVRRY